MFPPEEDGQALVELMFVVIFCFILGVGIFETGALVNNLSIMNTAMETAANHAAAGAPYERIQEVAVRESVNLMSGPFLAQTVSEDGIIVEVWHPERNHKLGADDQNGTGYRPHCNDWLLPRRASVSPYIFWSQGYEIRVGINYKIGFYLPFLGTVDLDMLISESKTIDAENDLDRDGLNDHYEVEYVQWAMRQDGAGNWVHPVHRDGTGNFTTSAADFDGDGVSNDDLPFDFDNDGTEDKLDKGDNQLQYNPLMGPTGWKPGFPCST